MHLPINVTQLNGIPAQYLSTLPHARSAADHGAHGHGAESVLRPGDVAERRHDERRAVAGPLPAVSGRAPGSGSTGVIEQNNTVGSSYFESLNVRLQKRFSGGLTLVGNYIHSKLIERD